MLVQVYGTKAVSRKCVYDWFKRFRDGKETTEDEPSSGRPMAVTKAFKPVVNTFSAHGFRPVHLHQHLICLRRRFP
jgi:transposase